MGSVGLPRRPASIGPASPPLMKFPDDWPQDCPPAGTPEADGVVFRIAKTDPPTAADVETHFEGGRMPKAPACLRCGLSVFDLRADAVHMSMLFSRIGAYVAEIELRPPHGKTELTPGRRPSHRTWWPHEGVDRLACVRSTASA